MMERSISCAKLGVAVLVPTLLCACGGGGTESGAGGSLTLSSATPASHNTTVDYGKSMLVAYTEIQGGASASDPYLCALTFAQAPGADHASYTLQVVFHPTAKQALTVLMLTADGWGVVANSPTSLSGVVVDTQAHNLAFNNLALTAANTGATDAGVLNGGLRAPPAGAARCVL